MIRYRKTGLSCKDCNSELFADIIEQITICPVCKKKVIPESMKK